MNSIDSRDIQKIIMEKALAGTLPARYRLAPGIPEDFTWHPVHWTQHPYLVAIQFNDDSVVRVTSAHHSYDKEQRIQGDLNESLAGLGA